MTLIELIEIAGYEVRSYSGRGMYGKRCVGVEVDGRHSPLGGFIADCMRALIEEAHALDTAESDIEARTSLDDLAEAFRKMETDSMGLGMIVYFPGAKWPEGREVRS